MATLILSTRQAPGYCELSQDHRKEQMLRFNLVCGILYELHIFNLFVSMFLVPSLLLKPPLVANGVLEPSTSISRHVSVSANYLCEFSLASLPFPYVLPGVVSSSATHY